MLSFLYLKKTHQRFQVQFLQVQAEFLNTLIRKIVLYFRAQKSSDVPLATYRIYNSNTFLIFFDTEDLNFL